MVDIDKYLRQTVEIKFKEEIIEVLQPTARMTKEIDKLESGLDETNLLDIKSKTLLLVLNNNASNKKFKLEDIDQIPYKLQDLIILKIMEMVYEAENDPN